MFAVLEFGGTNGTKSNFDVEGLGMLLVWQLKSTLTLMLRSAIQSEEIAIHDNEDSPLNSTSKWWL